MGTALSAGHRSDRGGSPRPRVAVHTQWVPGDTPLAGEGLARDTVQGCPNLRTYIVGEWSPKAVPGPSESSPVLLNPKAAAYVHAGGDPERSQGGRTFQDDGSAAEVGVTPGRRGAVPERTLRV